MLVGWRFLFSYCRCKITVCFFALLFGSSLLVGLLMLAHTQQRYKRALQRRLLNGFGSHGEINPGCTIPKLDPFDPAIMPLLQNPRTTFCDPRPPLTYTSNGFLYINETVRQRFYENSSTGGGIWLQNPLRCCYRGIERANEGRTDNSFRYDETCRELNSKEKLKFEFLRVECYQGTRRIYTNFHSIILIKPDVEERAELLLELHRNSRRSSHDLPSVLILGIDTISRLNFHRYMQKTLQLLLKDMDAVEMTMYNKVQDNTFPNVIPLLTGLFVRELTTACWKDKQDSFDSCSFLWGRFIKRGYRTLLAEDAPHLGIFNYMRSGFYWSPTDYYARPFMLAAQAMAHRKNNICLGTKNETQSILDWLYEFIKTFQALPYFAFAWIASMTHELPENAVLADDLYHEFFQKAFSTGLLNNTVIFFLSDHGRRWGKYRETHQGWYEDRLPFLFIVFPRWMREKYPQLIRNTEVNSKRLTTPFDIHETINDMLSLSDVQNGIMAPPMYASFPRRGISVLRNIPLNRTCSDASIPAHFCACQGFRTISIQTSFIKEATFYTVSHINNLLKEYSTRCAKLSLSSIIEAREYELSSVRHKQYLLVFEVWPSKGILEATVAYNPGQLEPFRVLGDISRLNRYNFQSSCIQNPPLQKFCFCINSVTNFQLIREALLTNQIKDRQ